MSKYGTTGERSLKRLNEESTAMSHRKVQKKYQIKFEDSYDTPCNVTSADELVVKEEQSVDSNNASYFHVQSTYPLKTETKNIEELRPKAEENFLKFPEDSHEPSDDDDKSDLLLKPFVRGIATKITEGGMADSSFVEEMIIVKQEVKQEVTEEVIVEEALITENLPKYVKNEILENENKGVSEEVTEETLLKQVKTLILNEKQEKTEGNFQQEALDVVPLEQNSMVLLKEKMGQKYVKNEGVSEEIKAEKLLKQVNTLIPDEKQNSQPEALDVPPLDLYSMIMLKEKRGPNVLGMCAACLEKVCTGSRPRQPKSSNCRKCRRLTR